MNFLTTQTWRGRFSVVNSAGELVNADSLPTATLYVAGVAAADVVTVAADGTGEYAISVPLSGRSVADVFEVRVAAVVAGAQKVATFGPCVIGEPMRGTDNAYTGTPPTVVAIREEFDNNSTQLAKLGTPAGASLAEDIAGIQAGGGGGSSSDIYFYASGDNVAMSIQDSPSSALVRLFNASGQIRDFVSDAWVDVTAADFGQCTVGVAASVDQDGNFDIVYDWKDALGADYHVSETYTFKVVDGTTQTAATLGQTTLPLPESGGAVEIPATTPNPKRVWKMRRLPNRVGSNFPVTKQPGESPRVYADVSAMLDTGDELAAGVGGIQVDIVGSATLQLVAGSIVREGAALISARFGGGAHLDEATIQFTFTPVAGQPMQADGTLRIRD